PGLFDDQLVGGGPAGALDALFGIAPCEFAGFADENGSPAEKAPRDEAGLVLLEPKLGRRVADGSDGRARLLNVSLFDYRDRRLDAANAGARAARDLVAPLLEKGRRGPCVVATSDAGLPLVVLRERRGEDLFLLVIAEVRRSGERARNAPSPLPVRLAIDGAQIASATRLDGERPVELAVGKEIAFSFDPLHLALLRVRLR
ncbi:MAG TPA: hypothetical protein VKE69_02455, partial [Planctomycetota bacterium]|nr:hypothetical protein [Planctomycetota bacterium]